MRPTALFVQYTRPQAYPPLEHGSRELARAGYRVVFLGIEGAGSSRSLEAPHEEHVEYRLLWHQSSGLLQKAHYAGFLLWVCGTVLRERPRLVYCSDLMSTPAGWLCAAVLRVPVGYHEHDTPAEPSTAIYRLLHRARASLARRALFCVIPNGERRRRFDDALHPAASYTVWNCPSKRVPATAPSAGDSEKFVLWYQGSIVPSQLPLAVVDALALLPNDVELRFVGYETVGHPGYVQALHDRARELGVLPRVRYLGVLPSREDMYREAARAHLGLALFSRAFREPMVGASNKPWEYLACGLPVLAGDDAEWREWIVKDGIGAVCNPGDPAAIAEAVRAVMDRGDRGADLGARGRERIERGDWNYEAQFAPVLALARGLLTAK